MSNTTQLMSFSFISCIRMFILISYIKKIPIILLGLNSIYFGLKKKKSKKQEYNKEFNNVVSHL